MEGRQTAKTFTDEVIYFGSAFDDVVKVEQRRYGVKMRKATKQRDVAMTGSCVNRTWISGNSSRDRRRGGEVRYGRF